MVRILLVFISAIAILLPSCTTTGSNVFSSGNRKADIVEALSTETPDDGKMNLALELPFADTVRNTPVQTQPAAEEEAAPVQTEEAADAVAPVQETAPDAMETAELDNSETMPEEIATAESITVPEEIVEAPANNEVVQEEIAIPELTVSETQTDSTAVIQQEEPVTEDVVIPLSDVVETNPSETTAPSVQPATPSMPPAMNRLIVDAMIASVVIVIMFTVATAIRSAYKMPLSYLLSAIIAVLISFLPFVICIIIGGMSNVWWSYFLLLLSFFIFRSGRGRRDSR